MRHLLLLVLSACGPKLTTGVASPLLPGDPATCFAEIDAALSDDALQGRGVGGAGLEQATQLAAGWMGAAGLIPPEGGWMQPFEVTVGVTLGAENRLDGAQVGEDFTPLGFSGSGSFGGPLVFAGYGITAPELGYDDYAGLDVHGKVVLALRYEPGEGDDKSPFDGKRPSRWSDLRYKAHLAKQAGASALIFVTGAANEPPDADDVLPSLRIDGPESDAGLPVLQVTRAQAARWLGAGELDRLQLAIDQSYKPQSKVLDVTVSGQADLEIETRTARNVVGVRPGQGALANEVVVVGAHIDHLGLGGRGSMTPDVEAIHNGADDNASGVAAMICGLNALPAPTGDRRTVVAIAFSAEEIGLGGSGYYVKHPLYPIESTVAMINLDMVGRVRENKLQVLGTDSAPEWAGWLTRAAVGTGLTLTMGGDGYGPSDQTPFFAAGVPVAHLFSGNHPEYHTPQDDFATINTAGGGQVARLLTNLVVSVSEAPARPTLVRSTAGPPLAGDSRGYGAYLGTIPDYTTMEAKEGGVLLSGVRAGGPAELAGLKGGDVIVGMGGVEIRNLYDMTFVLRDHKPRDTIEIVVLRDGAPVTLQATLGARGAEPSAGHGATSAWSPKAGADAGRLLLPEEKHLADLRQLTFGGDNAEAYWTPDGHGLIFQRTGPEGGCDQEYLLNLDDGSVTLLSSGKGRTTCGYALYPKGEGFLYSTTEHVSPACPATPDRSQGYVWPLYDFDIVTSKGPGGETTPWLPSPAYDAEATVCFTDGRVVFTSTRDGDLELYVANADGSGLKRLTNTPGYDGGAFFTPDCSRIVWRASRPEGEALEDYQKLLAKNLVRPTKLEIYSMNAEGGDVRRLTNNGAANFAPYPTPDGARVLYASNVGGQGPEFDIWSVPAAGGESERITYAPGFDGFPMFSPDGRWIVFSSNRGGNGRETNVFVGRWVE